MNNIHSQKCIETVVGKITDILSQPQCVKTYFTITMTSYGTMASQITSLMIIYSTVYSDADQRKHQSAGTGEFPAQMASNAENNSIWWRHHASL